MTMTFEVPRIIHQTWRTRELPPVIDRCVESVRYLHPTWDYRFYSDDDWHELLSGNPFFDAREFWQIPTGVQKSDVARMLALYRYGGAYLDVDILALRPLDSLIASAMESGLVGEVTEVLLTTDHPVHSQLLFSGSELLMNHFMVALPGSKLIGLYLSKVMSRIRDGNGNHDPVPTTGPIALTKIVEDHDEVDDLRFTVFPYFWTHPLPDMTHDFPGRESFHKIICDRTWKSRFCPYFVHCWWHNYHSPRNMMADYGSHILFNK